MRRERVPRRWPRLALPSQVMTSDAARLGRHRGRPRGDRLRRPRTGPATRPGARVLGLEQFEFGHANGASGDHSRIIRLSYHRPDYVRLAKRAYDTWAEVEGEAGVRIVTVTGGLDLWPADPAIPMADYTESLAAEAVPFELLDAAEVMRRWPQWRLGGRHDRDVAVAERPRGPVPRQRCAPAAGVGPRRDPPGPNARRPASARWVAPTRSMPAARPTARLASILAADAWTNDLLAAFDRRLPLTVTKEQVTYFAAPDPAAFAPDRFPVWIWMDEPSYYGIPTYGEAGPKAAQDAGGEPTTPQTRTFERDDAMYQRVRAFVETHLPDAAGPEHPHEDLPVHADPGPGLRGRSRARGAWRRGRPRCRRTASSSRRCSVASSSSSHSTVRRRPMASSVPSGSIARSCSRTIRRHPGWSEAHATDPLLHGTSACATVPPLEPGRTNLAGGYWRLPRGTSRRGGDIDAIAPARPAVALPRGGRIVRRPVAPGGGDDRRRRR